MLKKSHRLTKQREIDNVFKRSKGSYNDYIGIKAVKNKEVSSRAAIIVSVKVSKKAVVRNKLKRRVAHILKEYIPHFQESYDMVSVILPPAKEVSYAELKSMVEGHLKRLRVI